MAGCCPALGVAAMAEPQHRRDLPELALHIAATDLQREFSEMFGVETIERVLNSCYDELAARATLPGFLPLFAERFARQRLYALAPGLNQLTGRSTSILTPSARDGCGLG